MPSRSIASSPSVTSAGPDHIRRGSCDAPVVRLPSLCWLGFLSRTPKRPPSSSPASATRSTSRIRRQQEDGSPGDGLAEFTLPGETVDDWSKLFAFHAYPEMGDDPVAAVKMVGKVVKETNKDANFAIVENEKTGEAIIDFLTWTPESDVMEFNVFKYARAADGKGLVAMQYAQHIKLGDIDVEGMRALRARSVRRYGRRRRFLRPRRYFAHKQGKSAVECRARRGARPCTRWWRQLKSAKLASRGKGRTAMRLSSAAACRHGRVGDPATGQCAHSTRHRLLGNRHGVSRRLRFEDDD